MSSTRSDIPHKITSIVLNNLSLYCLEYLTNVNLFTQQVFVLAQHSACVAQCAATKFQTLLFDAEYLYAEFRMLLNITMYFYWAEFCILRFQIQIQICISSHLITILMTI